MKYNTVTEGDWVQPMRRGYKLMCCDCGSVHRMDFRLVPCGGGRAIEFRVFRDDRATAAARRVRRNRQREKA